jgi:hypothetical protein
VPALLGIAALVVAVSACPRERAPRWPWQGPYPVRNTIAFALALLALLIYVGDFVWRRGRIVGDGWARTSLVSSIAFTLLFASAAASMEHRRWYRWFNRIGWGVFAAAQWWMWHQWATR